MPVVSTLGGTNIRPLTCDSSCLFLVIRVVDSYRTLQCHCIAMPPYKLQDVRGSAMIGHSDGSTYKRKLNLRIFFLNQEHNLEWLLKYRGLESIPAKYRNIWTYLWVHKYKLYFDETPTMVTGFVGWLPKFLKYFLCILIVGYLPR